MKIMDNYVANKVFYAVQEEAMPFYKWNVTFVSCAQCNMLFCVYICECGIFVDSLLP